MSTELTSSFEPFNPDAMISDYNQICNKLSISISAINKTENSQSRKKLMDVITSLNHRKKGFENQFKSENIKYIKR